MQSPLFAIHRNCSLWCVVACWASGVLMHDLVVSGLQFSELELQVPGGSWVQFSEPVAVLDV